MAGSIFDRHHGMARFTISFAIGAALMVLAVGLGIGATMHNSQQEFSENPLYTTNVSIANGISGSTAGIWESSDHKRAFVAFKFDDDSVSKMPTDAARYAVTVGAVDSNDQVQPMKVATSASLYVFGSTGYLGIYLVAGEEFQPQLYQAYIQATTTDNQNVGWLITLNPAATQMPHSDVLDAQTLDPSTLYRQAVAVTREQDLRKNLTDDLNQMYADQQSAVQYITRLDSDGVTTEGMLPTMATSDSFPQNEDGSRQAKLGESVPGGVTFDWFDASIMDDGSYAKAAMDAAGVGSYDELVSELAASSATASDTGKNAYRVPTDLTLWHMKDGKTVADAKPDVSDSTYTDITQSIGSLSNVVGDYITAKTKYQTTDALAILAFENDVSRVTGSITSADCNILTGSD